MTGSWLRHGNSTEMNRKTVHVQSGREQCALGSRKRKRTHIIGYWYNPSFAENLSNFCTDKL